MGEVWKALDTRLGRIVAIKIASETFTEQFAREAHAIALLNHPHICQLYDVGPNYLVMEYVEGTTLQGPLPFDLSLKLAVQIAYALSAAHSKGIVHRDLKPGNILTTKSGVKLLDFGLASIGPPGLMRQRHDLPAELIPTEEMWEAGKILGTLRYMSPEQLQGRPTDARSDSFSFGLVLYEMLTGKTPYSADNTTSLIAEVLQGPPLALMALNQPALSRILGRCLATDPEDRWQSVQDLAVNLEWVALGLRDTAAAPPPKKDMRRW